MHPAAIITGVGLVSPLGDSIDSTWQALLAGRSIRDHARVPDLHSHEPRIFQIAQSAAQNALDSNRPACDALVVGTSKGEADAWIANAFLPLAGIGNLAARLGSELGIIGPRLTISAACASGLQALIRGALLITAGDADRVLVVAAESSLHPLFLANYRRLGVLAAEGEGCRPFDKHRSGFCLSEAAAAVVLEKDMLAGEKNTSEPPAGAIKKIALESFALGCDATHLTGSDPAGRPLRNLLGRVVAGRQFDLIHAHGTGTVTNDQIELHALETVLPETVNTPAAIYSHKAALGHSLGASGLISVVLNVQMHRRGKIPGNVNTRDPLPSRRVGIPRQTHDREVRHSLAIAAGFGGAMAAVSLTTVF